MKAVALYASAHADSDLNRYLGFDYLEVSPDCVVARQAATLCGRDRPNSDHVDTRALLAVTDHVMGMALHIALDLKGPLATVDLKMEQLALLKPGPVFIRVSTTPLTSLLAFVTAKLDQGDQDNPVAKASARFMVGAWPGGGGGAFPPPLDTPIDLSGIVDFASFSGLPADTNPKARFDVEPRERLIGARAVPAFHGGIVGAALQTAACDLARLERGAGVELINLSIEYSRAAIGTKSLRIDAFIVRDGRRTLRILATARQGDDRLVSQAHALFLIAET